MRERKFWGQVGIVPSGSWYLETGQGMGATLLIASEKDGYALTDRASFLSLSHRLRLRAYVDADSDLINRYSVMEVNPARFPRVNGTGARAFAAYLLSPPCQAEIARFGKDAHGQPLFHPVASPPVRGASG